MEKLANAAALTAVAALVIALTLTMLGATLKTTYLPETMMRFTCATAPSR